MDPRLQHFLRDLLHTAIRASIHSIFWKLPLWLVIIALGMLIGVVIYFQLY